MLSNLLEVNPLGEKFSYPEALLEEVPGPELHPEVVLLIAVLCGAAPEEHGPSQSQLQVGHEVIEELWDLPKSGMSGIGGGSFT